MNKRKIDMQTPDTKTGPYFVSAVDGSKSYLMAGPYNDHGAALAQVDRARDIASNLDGRAHFMAWGTCRIEGSTSVGSMTKAGLMQ